MGMKPLHSLFILLFVFALTATPAAAQERPQVEVQITPTPVPDMSNAFQTRQMFQQLLRQYPPFLLEVFQLDPSLLTNQGFLSSYPNLTSFLAQHPEIVRNPSFFVGNLYQNRRAETPEERSQEMMRGVMAGIGLFSAALIFVSVFCWVVKTVIDHRRWMRVSKVQSEVHTKLLDRFSSNQDLLAYMQTSAGRNFLEFAPISIDPASRTLTAPMNRILISIQAGVILALVGIGMHFVSRTLALQEIAQPLFVVGALALALGTGFVLSAVVAYALSRRLGLINQLPLTSRSDSAGVSPPHA